MNMTPFRAILALNAVVVFGGLLIGYAATAAGNSGDKTFVLLMPFGVSLVDFLLGIACLVLMLIFRLAGKDASTVDKLMQGFMASFGLVLIFAVPACMYGISR